MLRVESQLPKQQVYNVDGHGVLELARRRSTPPVFSAPNETERIQISSFAYSLRSKSSRNLAEIRNPIYLPAADRRRTDRHLRRHTRRRPSSSVVRASVCRSHLGTCQAGPPAVVQIARPGGSTELAAGVRVRRPVGAFVLLHIAPPNAPTPPPAQISALAQAFCSWPCSEVNDVEITRRTPHPPNHSNGYRTRRRACRR